MKKIKFISIFFILVLSLIFFSKEEKKIKLFNKSDFDKIGFLDKNFRIYIKNNKMGVLDINDKKIISPIYNEINILSNTEILCILNKNMDLYISGEKITLKEYEDFKYHSRDRYIVKKDKKYGLIDSKEKILIPIDYDYINVDKQKNIIIGKDNNYGVFSKDGVEIVPLKYKYIERHSNGFSIVSTDNRVGGVISSTNEIILPFEYEWIYLTKNNSYIVKKDEKYGILTKQGEEKIPIVYEKIFQVAKNRYAIKSNNKYSLYDENGIVLSKEYDYIGEEFQGRIPVKKNKKYGYISMEGKEIINLKYEELGVFIDNVIIAKSPDTKKYGVMTINENFFIDPIYSYILETNGKTYIVSDENGKYGLINNKNEFILEMKYEEISYLNSTVVFVKNLDDYLFLNLNNNLRVEVKKEKFLMTNGNELFIEDGDKIKLIML
ncbi:MAG: WG repeat-containing protein [Cetobacterium sp.]